MGKHPIVAASQAQMALVWTGNLIAESGHRPGHWGALLSLSTVPTQRALSILRETFNCSTATLTLCLEPSREQTLRSETGHTWDVSMYFSCANSYWVQMAKHSTSFSSEHGTLLCSFVGKLIQIGHLWVTIILLGQC